MARSTIGTWHAGAGIVCTFLDILRVVNGVASSGLRVYLAAADFQPMDASDETLSNSNVFEYPAREFISIL